MGSRFISFILKHTNAKCVPNCYQVRHLSKVISETINEDEKRPEEPENNLGKIVTLDTSKKVSPAKGPTQDLVDLPRFIKLGKENYTLNNTMMRVKSKKQREKNKEIFLEGRRLINDALLANVEPIALFFTKPTLLRGLPIPDGVPVYKALYKDLQFWSDVDTCPGISGVFKEPEIRLLKKPTVPLTIICDNIRDPGNMGSIIRISAGVGCDQIILMKGCVDPWEPKVLRSGAGSHFRIPILKSVEWDTVNLYLHQQSQVYLADCHYIDVLDEDYEDDEPKTYEIDDHGNKIEPKEIKKAEIFSKQKDNLSNLALLQYDTVRYSEANNNVLVIGGETEGLSEAAHKLAEAYQGLRVYIPLSNSVESFNSAIALAVISFEIKRQCLLKEKSLYDSDSIYSVNKNVGVYSE